MTGTSPAARSRCATIPGPSGCRLVCGYTRCASEADNVASCKTRRRGRSGLPILDFKTYIPRSCVSGLIRRRILPASMAPGEIVLAGAQNFRRVQPCDSRHHHVDSRNLEADVHIQFEEQGERRWPRGFSAINRLWTLESVAIGGV
jgi:hypothetical protein